MRDERVAFREFQDLWEPISKAWLLFDHRWGDAMKRHVEFVKVVHFFWWTHEVDD